MMRPSVYEFAGGDDAFLALAAATHERCVAHPVLNHPFSGNLQPDHVERLARYLGEVFGGPAAFSRDYGGHTGMLRIHARNGAGHEQELGDAFLECFVLAIDDAGLPDDQDLRRTLREYMRWAVADVLQYAPADAVVQDDLVVPRWSWDGLVTQP